ncbi:hypothetical protein [Prosthecobacter dejongeii]|uniref:Uncharacterized protein n=1 Tax=Prosthecobacter dejongeii TaxID=48465 RepID=A0A7W7YME8_9BACT|nr:hypothetical protein [Prosthecobacter dejongeii]MBB5038799.1 hypothetical protein [Prosthecobacter dejongeii]
MLKTTPTRWRGQLPLVAAPARAWGLRSSMTPDHPHPLARAATPRSCARLGVGVWKLDTQDHPHPLARAATPRNCARQGVGLRSSMTPDHPPPAGAGSYTP